MKQGSVVKQGSLDPLTGLKPELLVKLASTLAGCTAKGLLFKPYFGLRDPVTQAKLWRQSRAKPVIDSRILNLRNIGAPFIADCLEKAGPSTGQWATNAIPGLSWHQYGEAIDCFLLDENGKAIWDSPSYLPFGEVAEGCGLFWGGRFSRPDVDHLQLRKDEPQAVFGSMSAISSALALAWPQALA